MTLLAIDTALGECSIALAEGGSIVAEASLSEKHQQAEQLVPLIEQLLNDNGLEYNDLTGLAVTVGPGSFTGIRIGMAAAKGIALVTGLPITGVTTLETIAKTAQKSDSIEAEIIFVCLNAMRGQVYCQSFAHDEGVTPLNEPQMIDQEQLSTVLPQENHVVVGNFGETIHAVPHASAVAMLAPYREAGDISPLYIRPPDAKKSSKPLVA